MHWSRIQTVELHGLVQLCAFDANRTWQSESGLTCTCCATLSKQTPLSGSSLFEPSSGEIDRKKTKMMPNVEDLAFPCYLPYRIDSFKGSSYAKNRFKCSPKNVSKSSTQIGSPNTGPRFKAGFCFQLGEAGFYYTPTATEADQITCYACDVKFSVLEKTADPW